MVPHPNDGMGTQHTPECCCCCTVRDTAAGCFLQQVCCDCCRSITAAPMLTRRYYCQVLFTCVPARVQGGDVSVLMAVPTMYNYLLSHYEQHMSAQEQAAAQQAAAGLRLTVSGSAAAPVPLLRRWQQLSGRVLLERYGMTETGMILSNPYQVGVCSALCLSRKGGHTNGTRADLWQQNWQSVCEQAEPVHGEQAGRGQCQ